MSTTNKMTVAERDAAIMAAIAECDELLEDPGKWRNFKAQSAIEQISALMAQPVEPVRFEVVEESDEVKRMLSELPIEDAAEPAKIEPAAQEVVAVTHTCEDDYQHFLSTHGYLSTELRREAFEAAWSPPAQLLDESQSWKESAYALRDRLSVALEELAALKADLRPPDEQGQWVNCSPSLLNAGVSCANTPRRASKDPCNSHDHFIAWRPSPQPPAIVALAQQKGNHEMVKADVLDSSQSLQEDFNRLKAERESDKADAERLRGFIRLCGYVENGSDTVVTLFQDDATREWFVKLNKTPCY